MVLGLLGLGWWAYRAAFNSWFGTELALAEWEVAVGRFDEARDRLVRLLAARQGEDEVRYHIGLCEEASGHPDRALAAWARIAPDSPHAELAGQRRRLLVGRLRDGGRFTELETALAAARDHPGPGAAEAGRALAELLRFECRFDEARRVLREEWPRAPDPSRSLRELWLLDAEPVPVEMVRGVLDPAAARAPDDDRVWLGRANLATLSGQLEEADRWLTACLERRPLDPAVWRARLAWARAAGRPDLAERALAHLPADRLDPAEVLEWRAWFARGRGDPEAERLALERLIEEAPGEAGALERLAILALESGRADRAGELRRRKDEVDRAAGLYRTLLAVEDGAPDPRVAARLAESLGRWPEARGWWTLAARDTPEDPEVRDALDQLARRSESRPPVGSLSDLVTGPSPIATPTRPTLAIVTADFSDDAETAGLRFTYDNGRTEARHLPETMGGGGGLLDFDGDGWLDVYCVQGGSFPPDLEGGQPRGAGGDRLFRNRGDGTFEDATQRAGISDLPGGYGHGVTVGDYDQDGHPDLFITRWRSYGLFRNRGDGTFEDVTATAGLGGDRDWPTSAAWADLDGDGDLDLYVCHYLAYDAEHPTLCGRSSGIAEHEYCDPRRFPAVPDHLFRNDDGRFVDVTAEAGLVDRDGRGLGVVASDLDGDGRIDLYVANDTTANFLYRNLGGLRFEEIGVTAGVAASGAGGYEAGMGVACGDLDGDGRADLVVTNFLGEGATFYRNLGPGLFGDESEAVGLTAASRPLLGFGIALLDFNADGRLDLATANGHVNDYRPAFAYAMPAQLLAGAGDGRLVDVASPDGSPWETLRVGRGLAAGDLDNDGRIDLLIVAQGTPLAYLHNRTEGGHSLTLLLEGTSSNRDGVGARVTVTSGGPRQVLQRVGGGSYLSASDPRLHIGLGTADRVEVVEVTWPSGQVDSYRNLPADTGYRLREGHDEPLPLEGFPRDWRAN